MERTLFDKGEAIHPSPGEVAAAQSLPGNPRLRVPQRNQVEMHWTSLDELLEPDHPVRMVWACVHGLDLGRWLTTIKAVEGVAGRDATAGFTRCRSAASPSVARSRCYMRLRTTWFERRHCAPKRLRWVDRAKTAKGGGARQASIV